MGGCLTQEEYADVVQWYWASGKFKVLPMPNFRVLVLHSLQLLDQEIVKLQKTDIPRHDHPYHGEKVFDMIDKMFKGNREQKET